MNEVKAFIRKRKAEEVINGLGRMSDPEKAQLSISYRQICKSFPYWQEIKSITFPQNGELSTITSNNWLSI